MMQRQSLRFEFLEDRILLAVWSGGEWITRSNMVSQPEVTSELSGERIGDVCINSIIDIDGDGFVGPSELSYLSYSWLSSSGDENWNPACDFDGDGFVGPGDYALLSSNWFKSCDMLSDEMKSYQVYPSDISNWAVKTESINSAHAENGILSLDATFGAVEAICTYDYFPNRLRVTADFRPNGLSTDFSCGIELAVQESGERYYFEFRQDTVFVYYVDTEGVMILLSNTPFLFEPSQTYTVWAQITDEQIACGVDDEPLVEVFESSLTGGRIGFYASNGISTFENVSVQSNPDPVDYVPTRNYVVAARGLGYFSYAAFPDICRLDDGRLMAVVYVGYGHVSHPNTTYPTGGRICAAYSSDEGVTWSALQTIADTRLDDRDPSVVQLEDGRILCTFFTLPTDDSSSIQITTKITESSDGGKTWSSPKTVYEGYAVSSPIRVISNGSLLMPLYRQANNTAWGAVGISHDNGATWKTPVTIPRNGFRLDAETDVIERNDHSLYAIQRYEMAYSISYDYGRSWSKSVRVGFNGQCPYLFRASNGVVIMALRENSNTTIRISVDDCKSWSDSIVVDNVAGAYPSIVERKDGTLLIIYYEEGDASNIRVRRFSLTDDGTVLWRMI